MLNQPTPKVTASDVERVVRRDFPPSHFERVLSTLGEYTDREEHRVRLAVLKLANGSVDALREELERAKNDYRDVLVLAEYPLDWRYRDRRDMSHDEKRDVYEADWKQYQEWLQR